MKKRLLSILLTLCMVLALLPGTALAALTPTSDVTEWADFTNGSSPMTPEAGIAPISIEIEDGNCTFIEQEDTLYEIYVWSEVLEKIPINGFYAVKSGSKITVSHTGDDPASIFYITLDKFSKSAESNIVKYYENLGDEQTKTADFKDNYFRYYVYSNTLASSPNVPDDYPDVEAVEDGSGHYWVSGPFGFFFDDDAREAIFDEDVDAILLHPGESVTFTIPDEGPDPIYQLCATIIYPEHLGYYESKYAIKFDNNLASSAPAEPEQPSTPAGPEQPTESGQPSASSTPAAGAVLSPQKLTVDGKNIDCEKYNIGGSNYFKLRDLAYLLNNTGSQFGVGFDEATSTVSITTKMAYMPAGTELVIGADNSATAQTSAQSILIDGEAHGELTVYNIGGSNFFQLRELGTLLNFEVDYDADTNTAIVRSVQN